MNRHGQRWSGRVRARSPRTTCRISFDPQFFNFNNPQRFWQKLRRAQIRARGRSRSGTALLFGRWQVRDEAEVGFERASSRQTP